VIDYTAVDFAETVRDVVFDNVGGEPRHAPCAYSAGAVTS
jgi:hypothetical protein